MKVSIHFTSCNVHENYDIEHKKIIQTFFIYYHKKIIIFATIYVNRKFISQKVCQQAAFSQSEAQGRLLGIGLLPGDCLGECTT